MRQKHAYKTQAPLRARHTPALTDEFAFFLSQQIARSDKKQVTWLDVGCGRGQLLKEACRSLRMDQRCRVAYTGYDCTLDFVEDCNATIESLRIDNSRARQGEFDGMDALFNAGPFDVISVVELISDLHLHLVPRLVLNIFRLCHSSTVLCFSDLRKLTSSSASPGMLPWSEEEINPFVAAIARLLDGPRLPPTAFVQVHKNAWSLTLDLGAVSGNIQKALSFDGDAEGRLVGELYEIFEKRRSTLDDRLQRGVLEYRQLLRAAQRERNEANLEKKASFFTGDPANGHALDADPVRVRGVAENIANAFQEYWACESEVSLLVQQ